MINGKMYKVLIPIEGSDGKTTHWMKAGNAFTNKDESLNAYIDTLPVSVFAGKQLKLQIRELDEEDLRRREDRKRSTGTGLLGDGPPSFDHRPTHDDRAPF